MLEWLDLPLEWPILMFSVLLLISLGLDIAEGVIKRFLFAISLIGATIQDNGKEERSNGCHTYITWYFT